MGAKGEIKLSKTQTIRKRELRRAIQRLHEHARLCSLAGNPAAHGVRSAITILGEMRKEIDNEQR